MRCAKNVAPRLHSAPRISAASAPRRRAALRDAATGRAAPTSTLPTPSLPARALPTAKKFVEAVLASKHRGLDKITTAEEAAVLGQLMLDCKSPVCVARALSCDV